MPSLVVVEVCTECGTEWLLAADISMVRPLVADLGWEIVAVHDSAEVLHQQYGGIAALSSFP